MKWVSSYTHPENWNFEITRDSKVGYYLWIFKNEATMDYLQDTLEMAKEQAYEDFEVPLSSWAEVPEK